MSITEVATASVITMLLTLLVAISDQREALTDTPTPVNVKCMLANCPAKVTQCFLDQQCRAAITCAKKCWDGWDADTTSEKFRVQNCSNKCAFSYRDEVYLNFMDCVGDNQCMKFPPILSQCKAPGNISILKKLSTSDLKGDWWVVAGKHPLYDCYPCQHQIIKQVNATTWSYQPKYLVYLVNNSLSLVDETFFIPDSAPGSPINFVYHDAGLNHNETWYLVDSAQDGSYVIVYYCGNTLQWFYDGSLVLSRNQTLPSSSLAAVASSILTSTGLQFSDYCKPQTTGCSD